MPNDEDPQTKVLVTMLVDLVPVAKAVFMMAAEEAEADAMVLQEDVEATVVQGVHRPLPPGIKVGAELHTQRCHTLLM